jgi:acyl-CoA thioesterase-2
MRFVDEPVWSSERSGASEDPVRVWMRADGTLPDDRLLHVCLLTYASDMTLLGSVPARHHIALDNVQMASLDHAMWFHRPFRADEWLLYTCHSPTASGSRGLATGRFTTRDGRLVATIVQEGLVRVRRN